MKSDKEFVRLVKENEEILRDNFQKNFKTQRQTLDLLIDGVKNASYNHFLDTKLIWNIAGFIDLTSFDLKVIGQDLAFAENDWQKKLFSRQACLIIYESINDLFDLLGKEFKRVLKSQIKDPLIEEALNAERKKLNIFKKANIQKLKEIRNVAIAHRDQDVIIQINEIGAIKRSEIFDLVFDEILDGLAKVFQKIINKGLSDFNELSSQI